MTLLYPSLLLVAGLIALASGLLVLFRPKSIKTLNRPMGELLSAMRSNIRTERWYYRYHQFTGPLTMLGGAVLCLSAWIVSLPQPEGEGWVIFLHTLKMTFALSGPLVIIFGLVVTLRPSALKPLEYRANTIITWQGIKNLVASARLRIVDQTLKHPRVFGILAVGAGIFLLGCTVSALGRM